MGHAGGKRRSGVIRVGNRLGLCKVELLVEKSALGELARAGQAQTGQACGCVQFILCFVLGHGQTAGHQQLQHDGAAVCLQLQDVLSGVAVRGRKIQGQDLVDGLPLRIFQGQQGGFSGLERSRAKALYPRTQRRPAEAHNAVRAAPGAGGEPGDGARDV